MESEIFHLVMDCKILPLFDTKRGAFYPKRGNELVSNKISDTDWGLSDLKRAKKFVSDQNELVKDKKEKTVPLSKGLLFFEILTRLPLLSFLRLSIAIKQWPCLLFDLQFI
ncbi:hypothetical protein AMTR_s00102p00123170 [Amborella trichopoda]|uniref:Uncharacterized protein n=1 Tax=Amborella trichopoda TaxID=13333 RepID=W1NYX0_AMBTC|nr:hypothetical protein AMTR_s00102p00123170 [Amborella trichopoda]